MTAKRKAELVRECEEAIVFCKRNNLAEWFAAYYLRLKSLLKIVPQE